MRHFKGFYLIYLGAAIIAIGAHNYAASLTHILVSILTLSILAVAALQAILIGMQNYFLKHKSHSSLPILSFFPPIETMQNILFKLIWTSFIFLSLMFIGALLFLPDITSNKAIAKLLLGLAAWLVLATVLYGHHRFGWDKQVTTFRTFIGVILLTTAYFACNSLL